MSNDPSTFTPGTAGPVLVNSVPVGQPYKNPYFPEATLTPDIYWAHQPPAVRALRTMDPGQRGIQAKILADQGYTIDVEIMVYGSDAVTLMGLRKLYGYTWVPSGNQPNIPVVPGLSFPGLASYDPNNPPAGSIKVSIDAKDYPSFDPPPPPPPPPSTAIVGPRIWANVFGAGRGIRDAQGNLVVTDGQVVTQDEVNYKAQVSTGLMGQTVYFVSLS
jgi:hypothetical protein